jgi:enediyne biosynthesis protein E4
MALFIAAFVLLLWIPLVAAQPTAAPAAAPNFVDTAQTSGLGNAVNVFGGQQEKKYIIETTGTGVAVIDYDDDGFPDLFFPNGSTMMKPRTASTKGRKLANAPEPSNQLFRNNRNGSFIDVTDRAGLRASGWGQGACVGDFDNDGLPDVYITYYGKNRLYRNQPSGRFLDVTDDAGAFAPARAWSTGCAFVDYDRDGLLDIAVATYVDFDINTAPAPGEAASCQWKGVPVMCGPRGLKRSPNLLFHNLGNGKFENVSRAAGIEKTNGHYCFSVSTLDFDDDGWSDIYIACDSTPSILYRNNRDGTFTDVAIVAGAAYNDDGREQAGMGSAIGDYDRDGHLDIYKTNFSDDTSTLYHNNGDGTFNDATFSSGIGMNTQYLGWGTAFFDFDNDGWLDLLQVNGHVYPEVDTHKLGSEYREPRILYRNLGNGKFIDISRSSGPAIQARTSARGLAIADLGNDGSLEVIVTNMGETPSLLRNKTDYAHHWVGFRLVGTASNRSAIGARITLVAGGRKYVDEVRSGSSFNSSNDLRVHFGLGDVSKIDTLHVRWPNGVTEEFSSPSADRIVTIKEGSGRKERTPTVSSAAF